MRMSQRSVEMHEGPLWRRTQGSNAFLIQLTSKRARVELFPDKDGKRVREQFRLLSLSRTVEAVIPEVGMNEGGRPADGAVAGIAETAEGVMVDISGVVKILQANSY